MIRPVVRDEQYMTIFERSTRALGEAMESLARSIVAERDQTPALDRLGRVIGRNVFLAELLGRESTARVARAVQGAGKRYADVPAIVIPQIPFSEAVDEIVSRTPEVEEFGTEKYFDAIMRGRFVLDAKHAARVSVAERVLKAQIKLTSEGASAHDAGKVIAEIGDWTQAYGETVYRTNISRSFSTGRMAQVEQPGVREAIPAFRFSAIDDDAVRENHFAADGLIAPTSHAIWARFKPPLGFRCRCGLDFVDVFEYEDLGSRRLLKGGVLYPPNIDKAGPDPGFRVGG